MRDVSQFNLAGKDWFTVPEAAFYCGVSESQFREHALAYGLTPRRFMGKQLYERAELYAAIHGAIPWSDGKLAQARRGKAPGGALGSGAISCRYASLVDRPPRPYKPRKKGT